MAFARIVQSNLRIGGAVGSLTDGKEEIFRGVLANSFSFSSFNSVPKRSDFFDRLPLNKLDCASN